MDFTDIFQTIQSYRDLSQDEMAAAIEYFLSGRADHEQIVGFLSAMHAKGETAQELAGAALAMRASMIHLQPSVRPVVDTCGTGGDGSKTFNISTAAALVVAATGQPVAKHGNRKITSSTGSADVFAELGIQIDAPTGVAQRCLDEIGICFCFAPFFHPSMRHVGPARKQLAHPTIFNRLGPLANPAGAECQVLGVGDALLQDRIAQTLQKLGTRRSIVVRGLDGVDEISISAPTRVLEVTPETILEHEWTPETFGFPSADRTELFADDPASSAARIRAVFLGQPGACRHVVLANAAAALWLVHRDLPILECCSQAAEAIDSGKVKRVVEQLSEITRQPLAE
jgi:anthranilate phosphoribosyltransferase